MKKFTWSGMVLCSVVAFGSVPACGGDDSGDGDGDGDGTGGSGDGDGDGTGGSEDGDGDGAGTGGAGDGDGDAPATGGSGDGDGDGVSEACVKYCSDWLGTVDCNSHVETENQYDNQEDCETRCDAFTTDVSACRTTHLGYAMSMAPATHCGHAAEAPTGNCEL